MLLVNEPETKSNTHWALGCLLPAVVCLGLVPLLHILGLWQIPFIGGPSPPVEATGARDPLKSLGRTAYGTGERPGGTTEDPNAGEGQSGSNAGNDSEQFHPWTQYRVENRTEDGSRLVAGRKYSLTYDVRINALPGRLPNKAQLEDIALRLRSEDHHATMIYFFLPGMEIRSRAWCTAHYEPDKPFELLESEESMPAKFREEN